MLRTQRLHTRDHRASGSNRNARISAAVRGHGQVAGDAVEPHAHVVDLVAELVEPRQFELRR